MVSTFPQEQMPLSPGTPLQDRRYVLLKQREQYHWQTGASETWWIGQESDGRGAQVTICEVRLPGGLSTFPTILRPAMKTLMEICKHPHVPSLLDVFPERGRCFFVFELPVGESLAERIQRTGTGLDEQDVRVCCLQMIEVLEWLAHQRPPVVHGRISPEHLIIQADHFLLTTFSILGVSDAHPLIAMERSHLATSSTPEFGRGPLTWQDDLYALMNTMSMALTGTIPSRQGRSQWRSQQVPAALSPHLKALFARALHPHPHERYQQLAELRQALEGTAASTGRERPRRRARTALAVMGSAAQPAQKIAPPASPRAEPAELSERLPPVEVEQRSLLARSHEMLPLGESNSALAALFWLGGVLVLGTLVVLIAR